MRTSQDDWHSSTLPVRPLPTLEFVCPMPRQVDRGRPNRLIARQEQSLTLHLRERLLIRAGFGERLFSDHNSILVVDRPQSGVELPMRVLAQRDAVARIVVARVGELMNVGSIDDCTSRDGGDSVAGQRAGVIVGRDDIESKPRGATSDFGIVGRLEKRSASNLVRVGNINADEMVKRIPLGWLEVCRNQDAARLPSKL